MAPTVPAIMAGIQTLLAAVDGLTVSLYSPAQVSPPHASVDFDGVTEYRTTMGRGIWTPAFKVTAYTSAADTKLGQARLAELASVDGIPAAIEADRTLGGQVADTIVESYEPRGLENVGEIQCYAGTFTLLCIAPGV